MQTEKRLHNTANRIKDIANYFPNRLSNRHCLRKGTYREMLFSSVLWGTTWYERCKARPKFLSWMRPFASDFSGSSHSLILFTFVSMAPAQLHQARARKWRVLSAAPAQSRSRADHQPTRRRTFRPTVGGRVARGRLSVAACILLCFVFYFIHCRLQSALKSWPNGMQVRASRRTNKFQNLHGLGSTCITVWPGRREDGKHITTDFFILWSVQTSIQGQQRQQK